MKKIFLLLSFFIKMFSGFAQPPGGMPGNGKMQSPSIGHIYGKLVDSAGKPVSEASVLLMQNRFDSVSKKHKDFLFNGTTTKSGGEFSFEGLPVFGKFKLKVSATGYKPMEQSIAFKMASPTNAPPKQGDPSAMMNNFDLDLGNIKMVNDVEQLQAVTVTAVKPTFKMDIDKKTYNVEKDIVNAGGTAQDIIKNVPSVNVDIDGNVTLRNAPPLIYVDGRPTTLTLDQIPADAIESVEVITNPSAKYDASGGGAGILNIVLKKNKKTGYNGNLRAGVDKYGAMNGGADFSLRQGKFNFTASTMINQMNGKTNGLTNRYSLTDTPNTYLHQTNYDRNKGEFIFARFGLDYFATNRNTFSLTGFKVHGEFKPTSLLDITTDSLYNTGTTSNYTERNSLTNRIFNGQGLQFGFKHIFPKQGEEWTVDANFFEGKSNNNSLYTSDYYIDGPGSSIGSIGLQSILGYGSDKNFIIQTDYVDPISATLKLETGLRAALRSRITDNDNYIDTTKITSASTDYTNSDNVYAAYMSLTGNVKSFGYKLGLRAESSNYNGELTNVNQIYSNSYPISLFPSIFLSQKLKSDQELQFSITRRINRPNFFQLIPYTDYSDSLNITRGNPALVPEFTTSYELSYLKTFKGNNSFLASVYYKYTNNLITRYLDTAYDAVSGKQDIINTYVNANNSTTAGLELTSQNSITRWMDISTNINIYNSQINTNNISGSSQPALWSWFGKFNSSFKLPKKFSLQLTAMYQSKTNLPVSSGGNLGGPPMMQTQTASQGYIKSFYGVDAAIKRTFLKNDAASVSLSISDIFRSRWSDQYSYSQFFTQEYDRLRDPQMIRLNFSYRFGKVDASLFKRKSQGVDSGAGDMQ